MTETQIYQAPEKSIFIDLLDTEAFLNRYEHSLRGEVLKTEKVLDKKSNKEITIEEWRQVYPPKMNDAGISSTVGMLRSICDKATSLTDLGEEATDILIKQNIDAWLDFLCINAKDLGLASTSKINEVYYPARNLIISKIRSSVDGMIVRAIADTTNITENRNIQPKEDLTQMQSPGLLKKFGIRV
jgi:hypothetical protein